LIETEPEPVRSQESGIRNRALLRELLIVSGLILLALWIPPLLFTDWRLAEKIILGAVAIFALWRLLAEKRDWRSAGLGLRNFGGAAKLLLLPTLLPIFALLLLGWALGSLDLGADRFWKKLSIATFAGQYLQQAIVQLYFNHRAMQALGPGSRSAALVTAIFAVLHLPNPILTIGVTYGMWFWARTYQKAPNILAIALSHMLLSAFLWHTVPEAWRPSLTVGWRYVERCSWF
jgi:hypothetical protein